MNYTLYHFPLCPFSRKVRLCLGEKKLNHTLVTVDPWSDKKAILGLNPAGTVPVLKKGDVAFSHSQTICEYLEEDHQGRGLALLPEDLYIRAEVRRLVAWFDEKFYREVTDAVVTEKLARAIFRGRTPNSTRIRQGLKDLQEHMGFMSFLIERRSWLTGPDLTLADLCGGAHLSCLDYFGHVPWQNYPLVKEWYQRLKSRPSFRSLLQDQLPAFKPSETYGDLDF